MRWGWLAGILVGFSVLAASPLFAQERVERFATARGGALPTLVVLPPGPVRGIAVLLVGGSGRLKPAQGQHPASNNILIRARHFFAVAGFVVAIPDAPSDRGRGGLVGWRTSAGHMADISLLARRLRRRFPVPVWLIGSGRGAISAAAAGARVPEIAGVVLIAAITRPGRRRSATVFDAPIREVSKPVLVVHHKQDKCPASPPSGSGRLFARLMGATVREIRFIEGGKPAVSQPCGGLSAHGFYGVGRKTVAEISKWIGIFER